MPSVSKVYSIDAVSPGLIPSQLPALGEQGYISFTDDTSPDFKGEIMSLYEFWEYDPEQSQTEDLEMEMK